MSDVAAKAIKQNHNFARITDILLKDHAHWVEEKNVHSAFLFGEVENKAGKKNRGIFAYSFENKNGNLLCFHRFLTIKPFDQLMQSLKIKHFFRMIFQLLFKPYNKSLQLHLSL